MKKTLSIVLCVLFLFLFVGCEKRIEGQAAWNKFYSALELTTALEYYAVDTTITIGNSTVNGQLVLSTDEYGRTVAYRKEGAVESWWLDGVAYVSGDSKTKKAQSINSFLDISTKTIDWNYSMVKNVVAYGNNVTFGIDLPNYEQVDVCGKIDKMFLVEISVTAIKSDKTCAKIKYVYKNCGKKPSVTLPSDLSGFVWEV